MEHQLDRGGRFQVRFQLVARVAQHVATHLHRALVVWPPRHDQGRAAVVAALRLDTEARDSGASLGRTTLPQMGRSVEQAGRRRGRWARDGAVKRGRICAGPAEEIALRYDALTLSDVHATLSFYTAHRDEVTEYLQGERNASALARSVAESKSPFTELRRRATAPDLTQSRRECRVCRRRTRSSCV